MKTYGKLHGKRFKNKLFKFRLKTDNAGYGSDKEPRSEGTKSSLYMPNSRFLYDLNILMDVF